MQKVCTLIFLLVFLSGTYGHSQGNARDYAVMVGAAASPSGITLSWPADTAATGFQIWRKTKDAAAWGSPIATLTSNDSSFLDVNVSQGEMWEYKIQRNGSWRAYGYVLAGNETPPIEDRGKVIVVFDTTFAAQLSAETARLREDLIGDGWEVIWINVDRNDSVPDVKALIKAEYTADPVGVKEIFLLGHVPVPYSGNLNPDAHSNHKGAWPADVYYGEMDAAWGDFSVNNTTAARTANHNVPFDGKFDPTTLPSLADVPVGRVDFANMSFFTESEADLLKRYLEKDHQWRHKEFTATRTAVIEDNFGVFNYPPPNSPEYFAASGWRNFAPLVGRNGVAAGDFRNEVLANDHLWAYGCGGGSYTSCSGVVTSAQFAADSVRAVFSLLFGSYFGDWDSDNNIMRAALASKGHVLSCAWAGRPQLHFHQMGLGQPMGESILISQNNSLTYDPGYFSRYVHIALLGDPTLRQDILAPPAALTVTPVNGNRDLELSWTASTDTVMGYYVYAADNAEGPYTRISGLVTGTRYADKCLTSGQYYYMVRAVALQTGASGSYHNLSQGIFGAGVSSAAYTLQTDSVSAPVLCLGQSFDVNFSVTGPVCDGNTFSLEISDASGAFTAPLVVGTLLDSVSGNITGLVPDTLMPGMGYRVRVISDQPGLVAPDNGYDLVVDSVPVADFTISMAGDSVQCTNLTQGLQYNVNWDFGDGTTSNANDPGHKYTTSGSFTIILTVSNECGTTSSQSTIAVVGLDNGLSASRYELFPNPADQILNIRGTSLASGKVELQIVDVLGVVQGSRTVQASGGEMQVSWDISDLSSGVYFIRIGKGEQAGNIRFLKN